MPRDLATTGEHASTRRRVLWMQGVTLAWTAVELGVSVFAAITAHSPAVMAFGSDSLVELVSASVVGLQWIAPITVSEQKAARIASVMLFVLAGVVALTAAASLVLRIEPERSVAGIVITAAALVVMPLLSRWKRHEAALLGNVALDADATQSASCAFLAAIALVGMAVNAVFHVRWFDPVAALVAVPVLLLEARSTWKGAKCLC